MKVKGESEKVGLKLNIQKTKIMASGPITSWEIDGETVSDFSFGGSKITGDGPHHHLKGQSGRTYVSVHEGAPRVSYRLHGLTLLLPSFNYHSKVLGPTENSSQETGNPQPVSGIQELNVNTQLCNQNKIQQGDYRQRVSILSLNDTLPTINHMPQLCQQLNKCNRVPNFTKSPFPYENYHVISSKKNIHILHPYFI